MLSSIPVIVLIGHATTDNLDYDDLKRLIKLHTTQGSTRPRPISYGSIKATEAQQFEERFFDELKLQHERINDFLQVKVGELARRLIDLEKEASRLKGSANNLATLVPGKSRSKASKLEVNIEKAGTDIQRLSRFVNANTLAFRKLFKKYRKWTGSRTLGDRFVALIFDPPTSLFNQDFEPLFLRYTAIIGILRGSPAILLQNTQSDSRYKKISNSVGKRSPAETLGATTLHEASQNHDPLVLDISLATTPLSSRTTKAAYWIHRDNLINAEIFLLRHLSHRSATRYQSPNRKSPASSHSSLQHTSTDSPNYGFVICDDSMRFAKRQSGETVDDIENQIGQASQKAAASIRFSRASEAVLAIQDGHTFFQEEMQKKAVRTLWNSTTPESGSSEDDSPSSNLRQWISNNPKVEPLVKVSSHRTQFLGLDNSACEGVWVTLDNAVTLISCSRQSLVTDKSTLELGKDSLADVQQFPHAILEIRIEGTCYAGLTEALDRSHLVRTPACIFKDEFLSGDQVERVRGFSLETHAVAATCKPYGLPSPYWLSALDRDIRKVPTESSGRLTKSTAFLNEPISAHSSTSAHSTRNGQLSSGFSTTRGESSATSAPEAETVEIFKAPQASPPFAKSPRRLKRRQRSSQSNGKPAPQRYWNEFDDGSEDEQDDVFYINVDPETANRLPGKNRIHELYRRVLNMTTSKMPTEPYTKTFKGAERDLLVSSGDNSDVSEDETSTIRPYRRNYSTFTDQSKNWSDPARERVLSYSCASSFSASIVLLIVAGFLLSAGRKKAEFQVDVGVVIAVIAAFVFSITGIGCMVAKQTNLGWPYRTAVMLGAFGRTGAIGNYNQPFTVRSWACIHGIE
ncbi:uncharacterized protein KY384_007017 [Bacidia gigantensis]|uniref:uncharacterized protein n=1 Tax=Bacidia gigantensis TaxID=2732470 RepID=UPI001D03DCDF|nr:uncharacterized protein KY384_007017 [Bacidia gigantensis]KAG8528101.1 hypothetical protein KY384_007017 [Bacidia gigantensis]